MMNREGGDTIVALSSGRPPAAIAVVRTSGPAALAAAQRLSGKLPESRHAALRRLADDPLTLEQLSEEFDVSRERVRQLEGRQLPWHL